MLAACISFVQQGASTSWEAKEPRYELERLQTQYDLEDFRGAALAFDVDELFRGVSQGVGSQGIYAGIIAQVFWSEYDRASSQKPAQSFSGEPVVSDKNGKILSGQREQMGLF